MNHHCGEWATDYGIRVDIHSYIRREGKDACQGRAATPSSPSATFFIFTSIEKVERRGRCEREMKGGALPNPEVLFITGCSMPCPVFPSTQEIELRSGSNRVVCRLCARFTFLVTFNGDGVMCSSLVECCIHLSSMCSDE